MNVLPPRGSTSPELIKPEIGPSRLSNEIRHSSKKEPFSAFTGTKIMSPTDGVIADLHGGTKSEHSYSFLARAATCLQSTPTTSHESRPSRAWLVCHCES